MVWVRSINKVFKIIFLSLFFISSCTPPNLDKEFYENTLGVNIVPQKRIYFYSEESARSEGFSFEIIKYEQEEQLKIDFNYPIHFNMESNWFIKKWTNEVVLDYNVFDPIFSYSVKNINLLQHRQRLKELLASGEYFYSYYFLNSGGGDSIGVDLYLIDSKEKQVYSVYARY